MSQARKFTFNQIFLPIGILIALLVAFGPLLREVVAHATWKRIPCHLADDKIRFQFQYSDGKYYTCTRQNMWPGHNVDAYLTAVQEPTGPANSFCFVNGASPPTAVKNLDTWQHLEMGTGQIGGGAFILVATLFMVASGRRKKKPSETSSAQPLP